MTDFRKDREIVNNAYYDDLKDRWLTAEDDPVALLRQEGAFRAKWVREVLAGRRHEVLDIGCGAGFLLKSLLDAGHTVTGLDASGASLEVAGRLTAGRARLVEGDAYRLPFSDASFDAVTCMDFLEHVSEPAKVVAEAARVLKPGGVFFYHTFNRNPVAHLIVIKGVEWFVKNTPKDLHVIELFIKPRELRAWMESEGLEPVEERGLRPVFLQWAFWRMIFTGHVGPDFRFTWERGRLTGYTGFARKKA
ncbi:MAG: bifunctional 2-polyprenyl-6-hydroxyphenol methylase/3-demethylubiquinol 3-O-methyltransferase UbiG [Bdellovibrionaceae bacterium]|nr:bifunctional 2-polyprenyl-6-hydroxyphenol methylase/3-demethylubiquinol 3-O-methyltransferase UbiG [Pseudobdellovibrionaceae bacterium]